MRVKQYKTGIRPMVRILAWTLIMSAVLIMVNATRHPTGVPAVSNDSVKNAGQIHDEISAGSAPVAEAVPEATLAASTKGVLISDTGGFSFASQSPISQQPQFVSEETIRLMQEESRRARQGVGGSKENQQ